MSPQRRFTGRLIGFACACALLLVPVEAGIQTARGAVQPPVRGRGVQVAGRVQIPTQDRVMVVRPRPGQVTQLVISVANGGLIDGQSEPTDAGKQMIARFIASVRASYPVELCLFLVNSYSSPKARVRTTAGAATATTLTPATSTARVAGATGATTTTRTTGAAAATSTTSATTVAPRRGIASASVAQPPAGRGAEAAQTVSPQVRQRMQAVVTVRGTVQTGRAAAIRRQLVDIEGVATDSVRLYAHGESRPEAPQADAPVGDYVKIDVHRLVPMMTGTGSPQGEAMMIMSGDVSLPPFPWPPPKSTSQVTLRPEWLRLQTPPTLGQVGNQLVTALDDAGYPHHSYLSVPHGFALVAQLEQIQPDGTPAMPNRWDDRLPSMATMGFVDFLKALVVAPTGHYRVIAFIVTDLPWQQNAPQPTDEQAEQWLSMGLSALPAAVRDIEYTAAYQSTALVYQFAKDAAGARFVEVSSADTLAHLERAGLLRTLTKK